MRPVSIVRACVALAVALAAFHAGPAWGQGHFSRVDLDGGPDRPMGMRSVEPAGLSGPDPCLDCDAIYAGDCNTGLWRIDPATGVSTFVGNMPTNMFDIAITSDHRLFGLSGWGDIYEISACDASGVVVRSGPGLGNGMTGDILTTDLFTQGPPLIHIDGATFSASVVGGSIGGGPPFWCGASSGDLALNPADGLLYGTLFPVRGCPCAGADVLVTIDPATGHVTSEVGCIQDAGGAGFSRVYGLAFDRNGDLWGAMAWPMPGLLRIDPATAVATLVPVTGGYDCAFGIASCPVELATPAPCPMSQGFWKNHPGAWPVDDLTLGAETYAKSELLTLLRTPVRGDASLILGKQLIAAKLNIEDGSDPTPVAAEVAAADALLSGFAGRMPYRVRPSSQEGHDMTSIAGVLDDYNNRLLTPDCEERQVLPARRGGGCVGTVGAPMPPAEVIGGLLPFLTVLFVLFSLRARRH